MSRLRYVKSPEELKRSRESNPEFLESRVRSIRVVYETDAPIAAALLPRPLEPDARPEICVTFSHVAMKITPEFTFEIGSAIVGVRARYDGAEGLYLVTMPMTTEQAVIGGRETYGEPKKIAQIDFTREGDRVAASVARMGITYLEAQGGLGAALPPRRFTEVAYCFKAQPSCDPDRALDADPLLVRLEWRHDHTAVHRVEGGELLLRESPFDPVADVPVRRLVTFEYEEGTTESNGRVLRSVPGDWLLPFLHQRYDEPATQGIEVG
jgi:acetoacetate decarboxylase